MLPLHKDAQNAKKETEFHAGLWYDRFFNGFLANAKKPDDNNKTEKEAWAAAKSNWIKTVVGAVGSKDALQTYTERQSKVIAACGGQTMVMSSQWHFVTGLGNNHPVENGFAWHHTLGVPYLTGAAVKGMVRAWCEVWEGFDDKKIKQWFGDTDQSGELIFFDAIPTKPVQLKADIMTPHYGDWYAKGDEAPKADGSNVPADWHDPNPVSFLVVDKGASFQFGIAKRPNSNIDLSEVVDALTNALAHLGAGAKTAAGYGRMSRDKDLEGKLHEERIAREEQQAIEQARKHMSPIEAELDKWIKNNPSDESVRTWINRMESNADEAMAIALTLQQYLEDKNEWKIKKKGAKKERVQKIKAILSSTS